MTESEQNKLALVTGASRGIGKAIAIDLASSGLKVIGTATTSEEHLVYRATLVKWKFLVWV